MNLKTLCKWRHWCTSEIEYECIFNPSERTWPFVSFVMILCSLRVFSSQPVPCFLPADAGLVSALQKCVYANQLQYSRRRNFGWRNYVIFKIFIVNFRCFYFYRRAKIHLAYEKKYISESNMKWMFRWVRVLGNDACFYNRKRVIRGKGKRGEEKGGGDGRWR